MRMRIFAALFITFLTMAIGCSGVNSSEPKSVTEMQDFAFVNTQVYTQSREYVDDITMLNQWLRANRSKKVVSFSGVLAYREGVSGYIIYFVSGDNSQQKFARINRSDRMSREPEIAVHGIRSLQEWKNAHPNVRIISISTVPSYSGGVREFTICYE
ncbi:MAG: hypothetical protein US83_C0007G0040 [Candidatus Falkowbacteria bacterium GW2011_GWC2_38_22]|uniref:Uncharacterized protein n=1 Tax=Candidatus Falkowbacteria bacterium GW2011_GWE1_38_31 TaxID=1618638 RepID=A0A0G0JTD0_9BACT|nr:MAG: hypothetical protein US73_C0008G0017 [Candidatus Falkowbacteria bacterium GW2011_GWF2_38_1205]KKQ61304.1 MAG: hypothetical protein US83_C0007G0040 [Candidatus Falkowbacteria bacterium GW2011_GWC2_38_22]KKQ63124.1 MAG: hypothetical protein US84_C0008G0017 [Candidatus Falkowbacteria bacterium GW2011_GWF1_38_22]KKQ65321.1 MAG: hypothetical protein US87_C0008G0017 [Candidatus Falkowbacteria bacterium GW2011_GWE2_38_254]KKQ69897.1 MAG: hypothetical protein US91_C0008G0017 [Candidatus Falkowb